MTKQEMQKELWDAMARWQSVPSNPHHAFAIGIAGQFGLPPASIRDLIVEKRKLKSTWGRTYSIATIRQASSNFGCQFCNISYRSLREKQTWLDITGCMKDFWLEDRDRFIDRLGWWAKQEEPIYTLDLPDFYWDSLHAGLHAWCRPKPPEEDALEQEQIDNSEQSEQTAIHQDEIVNHLLSKCGPIVLAESNPEEKLKALHAVLSLYVDGADSQKLEEVKANLKKYNLFIQVMEQL